MLKAHDISTLELRAIVEQGENSSVEFKTQNVRSDSLAKEMVAFSNTFGGTIFIGIDDDGNIEGVDDLSLEERVTNTARHNLIPPINPEVSFRELDGQRILVVKVIKGSYKPYQTQNGKYLIRVGSTNRQATKEELSRLFQQAGLIHFDISEVEKTNLASLDECLLHDYWQAYYDLNYMDMQVIEKQKLLVNSDILVRDGCCSVGGLLLFGKSPQSKMPYSAIQFAVFSGQDKTNDLVNKKELLGTIPELIEKASSLVKLYIPQPSIIKNNQREEPSLIPSKVIREVIVNAVAHRDYSIYQQKISIFVFSDRIEVTSPGTLPNTLTVEKLPYGHSAPRNMFLLKFLDNLRFIDGLGRGIPLIKKYMKKRVKFEELGEAFRVTLFFYGSDSGRDLVQETQAEYKSLSDVF